MINTDATPALLFVLWFRERRGCRWRKVAQCSTRAECVNLMRGKGEYWLAEIRPGTLAASLAAGDTDDSAATDARPADAKPGP
jgi:hypothetical protein